MVILKRRESMKQLRFNYHEPDKRQVSVFLASVKNVLEANKVIIDNNYFEFQEIYPFGKFYLDNHEIL